jgi:hypothetical protein
MHGLVRQLSVAGAVLLAFGCAAATSGGGTGGTDYRKDLGNVTPHDFSLHGRRILTRYHYEMEQEDSSAAYQQLKTRWYKRYPYDDELQMGVVEIQTQITLRARSRGGGAGGSGDLRSAELIAQNMARMEGSSDWVLTVMSPMFKEYIDEIARELKTEFSTGIRVY